MEQKAEWCFILTSFFSAIRHVGKSSIKHIYMIPVAVVVEFVVAC